jgi:hypothetical protein
MTTPAPLPRPDWERTWEPVERLAAKLRGVDNWCSEAFPRIVLAIVDAYRRELGDEWFSGGGGI